MKRHLSVLMLFVRSTLYKLLLLALATAAAQVVIFALALGRAGGHFGLDTLMRESRPEIPFAVGFLLLSALICLTGCDFGSRQGYTLKRLCISKRAVVFWQSAANAGLLLLFWAAQTGTMLAICGFYVVRYSQPQAPMLVFYADDFLHSLMPLAETTRTVCNMALLLSLSVTAACVPVRLREGGKPMAFIAVVALHALFFMRQMGSGANDVMLTLGSLAISVIAVCGACKEDENEQVS